MKAAIYPGKGQRVCIEALPDPRPGPDDLLLRVARCGICGTDLSMTKGGTWDFGANCQFGHEYAGEIVEVGANVSGFRKGERVAVLPTAGCGQCDNCRRFGNNVLCTASPGGAMLGFSEFAKIPASVAVKLPSTLSFEDGALIEPLAVSLYGLRFARLQPGERVLVLGGGTVALYAIYWARRLGAGRVVAMSRSDRRKPLSLEMGADAFVAFGDEEIPEVAEALGGTPDVVLECVGAEGMLMKALMHSGPFVRVVSLGFCTSPDVVIPALASFKCASLQFAVGYTMQEFTYIAGLMDKGHCDPKALVSNRIGLEGLPDMIETLRGKNDETKVHVVF